jgi:AraC-like DNA-binding protein
MILWETRVFTPKPIASLPRLRVVASETIVSPDYRHYGKFRTSERHCLFKYTLRGEGTFEDGDGKHRMTRERGFLCEINDPRTAYYYPPEGREPWTFVWAVFDGREVFPTVRDIVRRHGGVYTLPEKSREIRRLMELRREDGKAYRVTPGGGARIVTDLLLALVESKERSRPEPPEHVLVRRAQETVARKIGENLNVTELASLLSVSREHLTRTFKDETAQTPHDYIVQQKMMLACHLLKETPMSKKEICAHLGYDEPAHFTRTFKRVMQMTPTQFRAVGTIPVA